MGGRGFPAEDAASTTAQDRHGTLLIVNHTTAQLPQIFLGDLRQ